MIIDIFIGYFLLGLIGSALYIIYHQLFKATPDQRLFKEKPLEDALMLPLGLLVSALIWPYLIYSAITHEEIKPQEPFTVNFEDLFSEGLINQMSVSEIEEKHLVFDPLDSVPSVPFGFLNARWNDFITSKNNTDQIFSFEKLYQQYSQKEVNKGYAAVNAQKQITHFFIYESYEYKANG